MTADPTWYWPAFWTVWVGAMVPSIYFLATWSVRTRHRLTLRAIDASGWVAALVLAYVRSALLVTVGDAAPPTFGAAIGALTIGAVIAALTWLRAYNWWRMRHGD